MKRRIGVPSAGLEERWVAGDAYLVIGFNGDGRAGGVIVKDLTGSQHSMFWLRLRARLGLWPAPNIADRAHSSQKLHSSQSSADVKPAPQPVAVTADVDPSDFRFSD